ncbi:MAG TPA: hypothetical protein VGJ91_11650 [Polyangiaceae bacterium]|jgi:hypothetical protein
MPYPSRFTPYGMLSYSSRQTHARAIYDVLVEGVGDSFDTDPDGLEAARLYATAMVLGSAQYQLDRAGNNRRPLKATELLGLLEKDYQIVPAPDATLNERRRELAARARISKGNRRGAMEYALRTLLGDDFIEFRTVSVAQAVSSPAEPAAIGAYPPRGTAKKTLRIAVPISQVGVPISVPFAAVGESQLPIAGERYSVDPDTHCPNIESVTLAAVSGLTLTATFSKPHGAGAVATNSNPAWISNKRYVTVVVTLPAAKDPEKRRKIHEFMERAARGVTQWAIAQSTPGFFTCDHAALGLTDCVPVQ